MKQHPEAHTVKGWKLALDTFDKYLKGYPIFAAEHDIIYMYVTTEALPPDSEDGKLVKSLGWHVDSYSDGWAHFV